MKLRVHKTLAVLLALLILSGIATPAMAVDHSFHDVRVDRWYAEAVQFVYENKIMDGVGGGRFNPQGNLTRAGVTALLFRVHNERTANGEDSRDNPFDDVGDTWYAPYVTWAFDNDIVEGMSPTRFHPHRHVTRQEFAAMLYRYAMSMTDLYNENMTSPQWLYFEDSWEVERWAYAALHWMNFHGIVTGTTPTTINPIGTASRAETAAIMMRFIERLAHPQIPMPPLEPLCPELELRIREDFAARSSEHTTERV